MPRPWIGRCCACTSPGVAQAREPSGRLKPVCEAHVRLFANEPGVDVV